MRGRSKIISLILLLTLLAAGAYFFFWHQKKKDISPIPEEAPVEEERTFIDIAPQTDCSNDCQEHQGDQEKYDYCRTVCGFTIEDGVVKPPTSTDPELSQDYQKKDTAVNEKDIQKCQDINDENIKKTCRARVTEDMLEAQGGNGF